MSAIPPGMRESLEGYLPATTTGLRKLLRDIRIGMAIRHLSKANGLLCKTDDLRAALLCVEAMEAIHIPPKEPSPYERE